MLITREISMKEQVIKALCVSGMVGALALFTSGCAKDNVPSSPADGSGSGSSTSTAPDIGDNAGRVESIDSDGGRTSNTGKFKFVEGRTHKGMLPIYFDFDRSDIRNDQKSRIEANTDFLKANSNYKITIEGNTDERGTNEYNIALGERRALVAKKYMMNLGIGSDRIYTLSYGEEKPLLFGHDEYSWSQNRRDDFIIQ